MLFCHLVGLYMSSFGVNYEFLKRNLSSKQSCARNSTSSRAAPVKVECNLQNYNTSSRDSHLDELVKKYPPILPSFILHRSNIYMSSGHAGVENAIRIVKEQIELSSSSASLSKKPVAVHYKTVGKPFLNDTYVSKLCLEQNIECHRMNNHFSRGYEQVTLDKVQAYC